MYLSVVERYLLELYDQYAISKSQTGAILISADLKLFVEVEVFVQFISAVEQSSLNDLVFRQSPFIKKSILELLFCQVLLLLAFIVTVSAISQAEKQLANESVFIAGWIM